MSEPVPPVEPLIEIEPVGEPVQVGWTVVWSIVRVLGATSLVVALVHEQLEPPTVMLPSTWPVVA